MWAAWGWEGQEPKKKESFERKRRKNFETETLKAGKRSEFPRSSGSTNRGKGMWRW